MVLPIPRRYTALEDAVMSIVMKSRRSIADCQEITDPRGVDPRVVETHIGCNSIHSSIDGFLRALARGRSQGGGVLIAYKQVRGS